MKKNFLKKISPDFNVLWPYLGATNYVVCFESYIFDINQPFTLSLFQKIFPEKDLDGKVERVSFSVAQQDINTHLAYTSLESGDVPSINGHYPFVDEQKAKERQTLFWNIIKQHTQVPPQYTYKYEAYWGYEFAECMFWCFTYIFINGNQALVINADAGD